MKQINPGKYRHKIHFLQRVKGRDEYGEPVDEWQIFKAGIWASKDPLLGHEYFNALTTNTKVEVKFNMRYVPDITNDMRIRHGDEIYEILSAVNVKGLNRDRKSVV